MYATLGSIQFALLPITGLDERHSYDYAEHKVIEGKPLLQFIGDNLDELNIGIRFHFTFCDVETQFNALKAEADKHQALPFFFNNGKQLGRFVITELGTTTVITADNGRPLCIEARLSLKEWVDINPLGSKQAAQQKGAPGLAGKGPVTNPAPAPANKQAVISGEITASAAQIKQDAAKITTLTSTIEDAAAVPAAQLRTATSGITAKVGPVMDQARNISTDATGASGLIAGYAANISSFSSDITRITSGLPGPLGTISRQIGAINSRISGNTTKITTLSNLAGGGTTELGTRAQMITRMLPK